MPGAGASAGAGTAAPLHHHHYMPRYKALKMNEDMSRGAAERWEALGPIRQRLMVQVGGWARGRARGRRSLAGRACVCCARQGEGRVRGAGGRGR